MMFSRRDLALLLPALAAANVEAQQQPTGRLPSKVYHSPRIPYSVGAANANKKGRQFFDGAEHSGFRLEAHETVLGAGTQTHDPHKHEHDEMVILIEGTVEALIEGQTEVAEAGSVIYFASNQMHSVRNIGATPCRYYVVELRGKEG
jgi:quercetin dioxygenase-like cupin family protein